ncbi:MAG: DUF5694 domain-containing protein [Thermonemataceae bacterium]|mgnify:CR=1 FL=1
MLRTTLLSLLLLASWVSRAQSTSTEKKEVLLIGTFHFNNPGKDVAKTKTFDILNERAQKELMEIAQKINDFNPTKIFVEWPYDEQQALDSLYQLYRAGRYYDNKQLSDFYLKNEIFQLAFRVAKLGNLMHVYGVDYNDTSFPFDSMMQVIREHKQVALENEMMETINHYVSDFDNQIAEGASLLDLLYYVDGPQAKKLSNRLHNQLPLLAGDTNNFMGAYLTAEWYKRNLYIWSLIQKQTTQQDQRIMVLLGASHTAIIETFIVQNDQWKVYTLSSIMK